MKRPTFHWLLAAWLGLAAWPAHAPAQPVALEAATVIHCNQPGSERPTVVTGVAVTPDGRSVIAATDDHSVTVWDTATAELQHRFVGHADWVRAVSISPDARLLASGANDCTVCLWDLDQRAPIVQLPACDGAVACVAVHANGQQVAVVGFAERLQIVNTSTGQVIQQYECAGAHQRAVAFSPDGVRMAAAGRNGRIRIWNTASGVHERDVDSDRRPLRALTFSPESRLLAAAGDGTRIFLFDAASGNAVGEIDVRPAKVYALVFVAENRLAGAGSDNVIRVWDVPTRQVTNQLLGHTGTVTSLAFSSQAETLVSGSYDTTVRVWKLNPMTRPVTAVQPIHPAVR
jgi:WD40 repeat protein